MKKALFITTLLMLATSIFFSGCQKEEDFVRFFGPGDHWGERSLADETEARGTLTATEDTRVMILQRSDFQNLSTGCL